MKQILLLTILTIFFSCNQQSDTIHTLQKRIDSLETKLANSYKPGFGELMGNVQLHHSKLWFAGINKNWQLADFEIRELKEVFALIKKYQIEREESKLIGMIDPAIHSMRIAVEKRNPTSFRQSYGALTASCNKCHASTNFGFNVVKQPTEPSFTNQDFSLKK